MKNSLLIVSLDFQGAAPEWLRVLPLGKVELRDSRAPFEVTLAALAAIVENFRAGGVDLVVDYEHQSLSGGKAPAAGWIKDLEGRPDGLYARIKWTAAALKFIHEGEYRYYSPVISLDPKTRQPSKLMHLGLTNVPAIKNLPPLLAAKYGEDGEPEILVLRDFTTAERKQAAESGVAMPDGSFPIKTRQDLENAVHDIGRANDPEAAKKHIIARAKALGCMDILPADWPGSTKKPTDGGKPMKKEVMKLLGLPEAVDKPDQEILTLVAARLSAADSLPEIAVALGLEKNAEVAKITGTILALKQGQGELEAFKVRVETLETERRHEKAQAAVDEALKAGKLTPAESTLALKDAERDLEGFKARMVLRPTFVPVGKEFRMPRGDEKSTGLPLDAPPDQVLALKAQKLAKEKGIDLAEAQRQVMDENPKEAQEWHGQ